MNRLSFAAIAASMVVAGCASSPASIQPRLLEAADTGAPGSTYQPPENPLGGTRPRTLGLEIGDPTRMHHPEKAPEVGTPNEHGSEDHSQHGAGAKPTPSPKPSPTHKATPTPTPRAPASETIYACPMHPEVRDTKPGKCSKCGMALEPVKEPKPAPDASPKSSPKASPSPAATPSGHEHHHGTTP